MIPSNITRNHILKALHRIEINGVPDRRGSRKFQISYKGKLFPPKYVISLANFYANGKELQPSEFSGGEETNTFLNKVGFEVVKIGRGSLEEIKSEHDERCPECKKTIHKFLKRIYDKVFISYAFKLGTKPEDYKNSPFYKDLANIFRKLQEYRGYLDFVRTKNLPAVDFFIPVPGFVLEFDESQHFTIPRRLTLSCYPKDVKLGFIREKWIQLCGEIQASDSNPLFRDEQRAWYDTLRDFLPNIEGLSPTIRLYSKEMKWCSLDPEDPNDVDRFKNILKQQDIYSGDTTKNRNDWLATVLLESKDQFGKTDNDSRKKALVKILNSIVKGTKSDGVILFPGGYFNSGKKRAATILGSTVNCLRKELQGINRNVIICLGIDGRMGKGLPLDFPKDQLALAVSKKGIIAIGRKFHPTEDEKGQIEVASTHQSLEEGKPRIFSLNGRKFFLAICYDIFGIKQKSLPNTGIDIILNTVHQFTPRCKCEKDPCKCGGWASGDVYFARHGFAGASKQWRCPVFGSVAFFKRHIPQKWPSGVYWNRGNKETKKWKYGDNPVKVSQQFYHDILEGKALIRIYDLMKQY